MRFCSGARAFPYCRADSSSFTFPNTLIHSLYIVAGTGRKATCSCHPINSLSTYPLGSITLTVVPAPGCDSTCI